MALLFVSLHNKVGVVVWSKFLELFLISVNLLLHLLFVATRYGLVGIVVTGKICNLLPAVEYLVLCLLYLLGKVLVFGYDRHYTH